MRRRPVARKLAVLAVSAAVVSVGAAPPGAPGSPAEKSPVAVGYGGAVSSVGPDASAVGIEVLRKGGNAVDAAVATSSTTTPSPVRCTPSAAARRHP